MVATAVDEVVAEVEVATEDQEVQEVEVFKHQDSEICRRQKTPSAEEINHRKTEIRFV